MSKAKRGLSPQTQKILDTTADELARNRRGKLSHAQRVTFAEPEGCVALPLIVTLGMVGTFWLTAVFASMFEVLGRSFGGATTVNYLLAMGLSVMIFVPLTVLAGVGIERVSRAWNLAFLRRVQVRTDRILLDHNKQHDRYYAILPAYGKDIALDHAIWQTLEDNAVYTLYFVRSGSQLISLEQVSPAEPITPHQRARRIVDAVPRWSSLYTRYQRVLDEPPPRLTTDATRAEPPPLDAQEAQQDNHRTELRE